VKRIIIIMIVLVRSASALLICARTQTPGRSSQASRTESQAAKQIAFERAISTQPRLNRYFHADVIPRLKNCCSQRKAPVEGAPEDAMAMGRPQPATTAGSLGTTRCVTRFVSAIRHAP
jgi:hypothetical protein